MSRTESAMRQDPLIARAAEWTRALFRGESTGHGADHALRVCENALRLADAEGPCDRQLIALAALLHDADDPKLFATENNANARAFLGENGVPADRAELICRIVNGVSFSRNRLRRPDTPEGRIVQDADRLDAMGAIGIARTFAYGGAHGRSLEDSLAHFRDKLLLLRDGMNTPAAREMAEERHVFLLSFLREMEKERGE